METINIYEDKRKIFIFFMIISNLFYLGGGYFFLKTGIFDNFWILFGWIVGYILLWKLILNKKYKLIDSCKYKLIKPEIEKYNLEYKPEIMINLSWIEKSGLIDEEYDDFDGSDFIKGKNFSFSYVYLTREEEYTTTNDEGETETETITVTVFDGIFFAGFFPKKTKGYYLVKKNSIHLSDILPIFTEKDRIKLDMPEFEKNFDVYGSNQIEGRYIFDFIFMQNLLEVYNLIKFEKFSINKDMYFITLPGLKFDTSIFEDVKECIEHNVNLAYGLSMIHKILFKEKR